MKLLNSLSVFFPAYNDAKSLPPLIAKTYRVLPRVAQKYEVIVVNDGSSDNTGSVVKQLQKQYSNLKLIEHVKNRGYGGALQSGFKNAKYDWAFYTDGDGQYDVNELTSLVEKVNSQVDVVNGYKIGRGDGIVRSLIGEGYNWILHKLYKLPIRDVDCDFRLIKKSKLNSLNLVSNSGLICLELVMQLASKNARFKEVAVHHAKRVYGRSQFFSPKHLFHTFWDNLKYYQNYKRDYMQKK